MAALVAPTSTARSSADLPSSNHPRLAAAAPIIVGSAEMARPVAPEAGPSDRLRPAGVLGSRPPTELEPRLAGLALVEPSFLAATSGPSPAANSAPGDSSRDDCALLSTPVEPLNRPKPNASSLGRQLSPLSSSPGSSRTSPAGRPRPPRLTVQPVSVSPPRQLHPSPSAPDLRQTQAPATSTLYLPSSWGGGLGDGQSPGPTPKGKAGGRNAKGLSLALGRQSAVDWEASSSTGLHSPRPASSSRRPPPLRTASYNGHFESSVPPTPSSAAFSQSPAQLRSPPTAVRGPPLTALITSSEIRDPTDGPSSFPYEVRPYTNGPVEVLPHLWIGCDENARDWRHLSERLGVRRVINVAKELVGILDDELPQEDLKPSEAAPTPLLPLAPSSSLRPGWPSPERTLRTTVSTPDLRDAPAALTGGTINGIPVAEKHYDLPDGKAIDYLHLPWSHGQADLVSGGSDGRAGFVRAGEWAIEAMDRGEGVLVHCQCGISRSATLVIAIVMQLAAEGKLPDLLGEIRGMHDAYEFVKEKSPWIGPNVSLIYQLLEWERALAARLAEDDRAAGLDRRIIPRLGFATDSVESEQEWSVRRAELEAQEEADQMDRDMVERLRRAKGDTTPASSGPSSRSSSFSSTSLGPTPKGSWRVKRRLSRSSLASVTTFEEDEDEDIVDRGGGSDGPSRVEAWAAAGQPTPSTASSDVDSQVIEPPTGSSSVPPRSVADRKHERQRSSTMSFVPSLATLPPSPTQATGGDPLAAGFQVEAYAPRPLIGRPRSRTHLSTSSPSHLPGTPQRSRGPADPGAFDTPTAAANGAETSAPVSSLQSPLSASPIAPRVPTVTADTSPNLAQQSTPSLSPSRKFGVHASPEQRRDAHRRSFSVDPLLPPLRPLQPSRGHRRSIKSISHVGLGTYTSSSVAAPDLLHPAGSMPEVACNSFVAGSRAEEADGRAP